MVSLAVGLYESLATGWIEGSAILAAVVIVAVVTATNDYMKEVCLHDWILGYISIVIFQDSISQAQ